MEEINNINLELYKNLFLIREAEKTIKKYYHEDEMKTPMHMSEGQEHIAAGVCTALREDDQVLGTYRSHALYLSKTMEVRNFFLELYGKENSIANGKAGSMHLSCPEKGHLGSSAIVASLVPVSLGVAFANKMKENNNIVAVFFGDGGVDEGVFWESINFSSLKNLPVLFVYEDNNFAVHTLKSHRHSYNIDKVINSFGIWNTHSPTTDVEEIYNITKDASKIVRKESKPYFLHFDCYRYLEHVGVNEDFNAGYRSKQEFKLWNERDPVFIQRKKIMEIGLYRDLLDIEKNITQEVNIAIDLAKSANVANIEEVYRGIYYEDD